MSTICGSFPFDTEVESLCRLGQLFEARSDPVVQLKSLVTNRRWGSTGDISMHHPVIRAMLLSQAYC